MSFSWFIVGAGSLPIQCAEILLQRGHRICGVVSDDEQLTRWAQERGIAHAPPGENLASFLSRQPFDYLLSVVNEHILSKEVLRLPRVCAINYHDAPLPRYAGTHATSWALMQRERFHGITWHVIAETVDAGDILKQRIIDIAHGETAVTLNAKCYEAAIASFAELVDDLARGQVNPTKQRLEERTFYPRYKRPAAACVFSWDGDAEDIDALIRALEFGTYPNPLGLAKFRVGDDFIVVRRAEVTAVRSAAPAGTITAIHADALTVATGTRDIALRRLQTVDGRDLAIPEFVERFGLSEGYRLEALGAQDAERATTLNGAICRHETFWVNRLASLAPVELPYRIRGGTACADAHRQASASVAVPDELEALLRSGSTTWARRDVLLAGFTALLARIGGMDSFDIGYSDATLRAETAGLERLFASTVPLRIDVSLGESFAAHVASVRERLEEVRRRGTYLRDIVSRYPRLRAVSRSLALTLPVSVEVVARWSDHVTASRGELALIIAEEERECRCVYDPDAVPEEEARRLLERLTTLLEGAAASPDRPVGELPILSDVEWHRLVYEWNATQAEYPREATLVQLFEAQVRRCPDAVAVRAKDGSLTYRELNARANQLARHLQQQGVGRESLVGVCLERTCELLVSLLGILKSGAAYVPLDPDYPRERLRFMAADAGLSALVTQRKLRELVAVGSATAVVLVDEQAGQIRQQAEHDLPAQAGAQDLVYVLYTSGSTGTPKGVEVLHGALVNYLWAMRQRPGYEPQDVLLAMSSLSFDIAGTELYLPLICGGRVELVTRDIATDGRRLRQYIESESVTMLQATPATMWMLLEAGWRGDGRLKALCGGEPMPVDLVRQLLERCGSLWNMYGPTEATVACSCDRIESASEPITIGRPMANVEFYILDQRCQPVPVGVNGELYIGGAGLARGYRGRPELTAEKFVPHPFKPGERLYRTGDLARWRADGRVEYVGRLDHQVKIRGYRIELGEIETTLLTHPTVSQAVVVVREDVPGGKALVGYAVAADGQRIDAGELRRHLQRTLPDYMVPQYFVALERFPLTPNGKIDRARLPAPERAAEYEAEAFITPRTPTEVRVAGIFAEVLRVEPIGASSNFFELGGHSLMAMRLMSRLEAAFEVDLPLQMLFENPTVAGLAACIDRKLGTSTQMPTLRAGTRSGSAPLSFGQQRLWLLNHLESGGPVYNIPIVYRLKGELDVAALERSLREIVRRHEVLRTVIVDQDGTPVQMIVPDFELHVPLVDVSRQVRAVEDLQALVSEEARLTFDLTKGPLIRSKLFRVAENDHVLVVTMHHIVSDGWSVQVFLAELCQLYGAFRHGQPSPLPELPIQFADYAVWQREQLAGEELERQRAYWKERLANVGTLDLPTDRPRPKVQSFRGAQRPLSISPELTEALKRLGLREKATLFMVIVAAFKVLLHRYSRQTDVPIGIPVSSRGRVEFENLIGFFVNTLVLRTDLSGDPPFTELLARVRETVLGAVANQDLPFEKVVEDAQVRRDLSRTPLFQVFFSMEGVAPTSVPLDGLSVAPLAFDLGISKFDLSVYVGEVDGRLQGFVEYNTDLFDADTIDRLVGHYQTLLDAVAADPTARLSQLPLLTEAERQLMLHQWNATQAEYPSRETVAQLFEAQARRRPNAVAVSYEGSSLTYGALNAQADALAHRLRSLGVRPGVLVGVYVERSLEMVVGLLAILKAGGAYVPLDPAFPPERLEFMLADSHASVLLTQRRLKALPGSESLRVLHLDELGLPAGGHAQPLEPTAGPDDLAYVLYTSGSTGKPKGVEIPHRALTNFLWSMRREPGCSERDVLLAVTTLSFDIAGLELYLPLICGARVELVSRAVAADGRLLREQVERIRPTMLQATPSTWRMLIEAGWTGTPGLTALIGGEALPPDLVSPLLERTQALWNMYGPTETTIWSSVQRVRSPSEQITVGRPIANTTFYILDAALQPVPIGVPGELYIGGDGLARGYRGRPELTAEKFIPHPFSEEPGARLYRTGDLACWRADGQVVHLGRLDHQVKVRGYRIELGEIETTLLTHPTVSQAVVIAREDIPGDKVLVGYVVTADGRRIDAGELRRHLQRTLPDYMVPQYFVTLERFPLTPNGKIDRARLPAPERRAESAERYVEPRNPTEQRLARIWAEVLGLERLGVHDDFFDLGGHSLKAVRMLSAVAEAFKVELPLQTLFQASTIAGLAEKLDEALGTRSTGNSGDTVDGERSEPRTATERRLLVIWERLLDTRPIGVRDDFFALQGDRDLLERMLAQVRAEFGVFAEGIPLPAFRNNPTIEGLARIIDNGIAPPESLLVCLQARGSRRPLFLIHAGGGYVFFYRALAERLGPDRPVYAIRAETKADGLGHPFEKSRSIEELAARYIAEIRKVQPRGPYSLGGACLGGVIAFEMARQLCAQGEEISGPVLLFDAFVFNNPFAGMTRPGASSQSQAAYLKGRIGHHLRSVTGLGMEAAARYLLRKIRDNLTDILRVVPNSIEVLLRRIQRRYADLRKELKWRLAELRGPRMPLEERQRLTMERYLKVSERLLARYRPGVYEGCIVVFKAVEGPDSEPHWTGLARGGMVCHAMAGTHLDMMEEPAVAVTAALVAGHLDEAPSAQPLSSRSDGDGVAAEDEPVAADVSRSAVG